MKPDQTAPKFEFELNGAEQDPGFAYNVGSVKLLVVRFELVRK